MPGTAQLILNDFYAYLRRFNEITGRSKDHFQKADWVAGREDAALRLKLYRMLNSATIDVLYEVLRQRMGDRETWHRVRGDYRVLIEEEPNWQLAETWFNSVTRKVFHTVGVDKDVEFLEREFVRPTAGEEFLSLVIMHVDDDLVSIVQLLLETVDFETPFEDFDHDVTVAAGRISDSLGERRDDLERIEMVGVPLFRGQGAYVICRMVLTDGSVRPLVFSLRNPDGRLQIDAVVLTEDGVSILFSFTRAYFQVVLEHPAALIAFLQTLMPRKRIAELYTSLGYNKHGKTELYRDLLSHVLSTSYQFSVSRGSVGLVMIVFDMDDYDIVFKIIRDQFPPPKTTTRNAIQERYRLVFEHDRAGRLVEAHEFEHLSFREIRFDEELIEILRTEASRTVEFANEQLVISHAYLERKVTPLDIYIREEPRERVERAIIAYGRCIKDLMVSNIFPGDMLLKNFGVTRHGRVVFYDYDELGRITDCRFRPIPESDNPYDDMADTPWFSVGEGDVFPAEFPRFMGLPPDLMRLFRQHHDDLFDHRTWVDVQRRLELGELIEIFPYRPELRISH
jgi:isocitrate dehydrogenase kinase/phosphatase